MNPIIESLLKIQALELRSRVNPAGDPQTKLIRGLVPAEVLIQFDRLLQRGKPGVAFVRHGVCGHCHMQVAIGLLASLHRLEDVYRCQNCGVYLSVAEETPVEMPPRIVKPRRRASSPSTTTPVVSAIG